MKLDYFWTYTFLAYLSVGKFCGVANFGAVGPPIRGEGVVIMDIARRRKNSLVHDRYVSSCISVFDM